MMWPCAAALRLASEIRSTLTAARAINTNAQQFYVWQKTAPQPLPIDPAEPAKVRTLRAANKCLVQEMDILKEVIAILSCPPTP